MRLLHPEVADRPCSDCLQWVFDEQGQRATRGGQPVPRPPGAQPPCQACPKQSPADAPRFELSARNRRLLACYYEARACGGNVPSDELTRQRLGWIEQIIAAYERAELAALLRSDGILPSP